MPFSRPLFPVEDIGVRQLADDPPGVCNRDAQAESSLVNINVNSPACTFVENIGVEPMTSCLQSRRSSQLS